MKHPGGAPSKYEYNFEEINLYKFSSEKELNNLLLKNIDMLMKDVFGEKVKSATDKKYKQSGYIKLKSGQYLPKRGVRLDLWVECESGRNYILEIKNPKWSSETIPAIAQLLQYSIEFPEATNFVVVSTDYQKGILEMIERYNLPIDFILITADQTFLLKRNG